MGALQSNNGVEPRTPLRSRRRANGVRRLQRRVGVPGALQCSQALTVDTRQLNY